MSSLAVDVLSPVDRAVLPGEMLDSRHDRPVVVFAHGSGSSRFSPRNRFIADRLAEAGFGTLLFDLLTPDEDRAPQNRFDIALLAERLMEAVRWLRTEPDREDLPISLFGASTGAAAALIAAAVSGDVSAVVSRGGRPDLAAEWLGKVGCPTLLIVGSQDQEVLEMNRWALDRLPAATVKELAVVNGATHLFEEPGTLEQVADLAVYWFAAHTGVRETEDAEPAT